jgi:lipoate-protein ligase B
MSERTPDPPDAPFEVSSLGRIGYAAGLDIQRREHARVLARRDDGSGPAGHLLVVEHDAVLTVSKRATAAQNILVSAERLAELGIEVHETDRGGDITYHGPGQVIVYPIVDLNRVGLNLHAYMRVLEEAVIRACGRFGLDADREEGATGVWVPSRLHDGEPAKVCAMGVRVRRWVTMHGLALNVSPDMSHFQTIVPCGLVGRPVTSLREQLQDACPTFAGAADAVCAELVALLAERMTESSGRKG